MSDLDLLPHMYAPLQLMFAEHCVEMELKAAHRQRQRDRQASPLPGTHTPKRARSLSGDSDLSKRPCTQDNGDTQTKLPGLDPSNSIEVGSKSTDNDNTFSHIQTRKLSTDSASNSESNSKFDSDCLHDSNEQIDTNTS